MQGTAGAGIRGADGAEIRTLYVWRVAIAAAMGGLLFGYDWVVIGGARQFYEAYFHLTTVSEVGWANSCALLGCLAGSLLAGQCAERFGRRPVLVSSAALFAVSSVATGWSFAFSSFIVWRILGGVAIGLASNVSPLYIAEISPAAIRGRLVSLNQFAIVVGILLAQVVNLEIARPVAPEMTSAAFAATWNVQLAWRWMFTVIVVPSAVFMVSSVFLPESPRWLVSRRRSTDAERVLARVGGERYALEERQGIERALATETTEKVSWTELMRGAARKALLVGVALAVLQQWTGINILFNYAAEVYRSAGYGANDIFLNIVITGTINLVFTIAAMFLVDTLGRRRLMLGGCVGIAVSHLLCTLAYRQSWPSAAVLTLTLSAIACYAMTLGPVTWVLIAEIFPNRLRSQGVSVAVTALWCASFLLTYTFPLLNRWLGTGNVFLTYGLVCLAGAAVVYFNVTETKGRTLEQIEADGGGAA